MKPNKSSLAITIFFFCAFSMHGEIENVQAVMLAAGKSRRFGDQNKMIVHLLGIPMVIRALKPLQTLHIPTTVIVGYEKELVMQTIIDAQFNNIQFAEQKEQLGTGHAVMCAEHTFTKEHIFIAYGDMPLLSEELITRLYNQHIAQKADITFTTAFCTDPANAYGRIVTTKDGIVIIEKKHFTFDIKDYPYVNAGIYIIKQSVLHRCLPEITINKQSNEFYLTDLIEIGNKYKLKIVPVEVPFEEVQGINTKDEFKKVEEYLIKKG